MRKSIVFILISVVLTLSSFAQENLRDTTIFPIINGPYLEQEPPGIVPKLFAKGIISSNNQEHSSLCISQDETEIWWSLWELPYAKGQVQKIYSINKINGQWTKPKLAPFSGEYKDGGPCLSYDGNRLYFYSRRPIFPDTLENDNDIWYVERNESGWGGPINAGSVINTDFVEANPVLVKNNNLYFTSNRNNGNPDIYLSNYENGRYQKPENIGAIINTPDAREMFFTVSPDESFIIFLRDSRSFSESGELIAGDRNLMISFKNELGNWEEAKNMGDVFNKEKARFPSLSPDGKYLFFTRYTEGNDEDFYWVDTKIIKDLKPQHLK